VRHWKLFPSTRQGKLRVSSALLDCFKREGRLLQMSLSTSGLDIKHRSWRLFPWDNAGLDVLDEKLENDEMQWFTDGL
jgi:hypothetical protein